MKKFLYSILAACTLMFAATSCDTEDGGNGPEGPKELGISVTPKSAWTAEVNVTLGEGEYFAVAALPTNAAEGDDTTTGTVGYSEETFIEEALTSIYSYTGKDAEGNTLEDYARIMPYSVYTNNNAGTLTLDEMALKFNAYYNETASGLRMKPSTGYTAAVLALQADGTYEVKTCTFTTPAMAATEAGDKITIETEISGTAATSTITAEGYSRILYGILPYEFDSLDESVSTLEALSQMNSEFDNYEYYDGAKTFKFTLNTNFDYYVHAVAVSDSGEIVYKVSEALAPGVKPNNATPAITSCVFQKTEAAGNGIYQHVALVGIDPSTDKVFVYCPPANDPSATSDAEAVNKELQLNLNNGYAQEMGYDGTTGLWSFYMTRPTEEHYVIAVAQDANGNYGPLVSLASLANSGDANTLSATYTPAAAGGDEGDDYWKQSIAGAADGWLTLSNFGGEIGAYTCDLTWSETAENINDVKTMFIFKFGEENYNDIVALVKEAFEDYEPGNSEWTPSGVAMIHNGAPTPVQTYNQTGLADMYLPYGGTIFVVVLVDNDGYLTLKRAAYINDGGEDATYINTFEF